MVSYVSRLKLKKKVAVPSWSVLKKWGKDHPQKLAQLKKLRSGEQLAEIAVDKGSEQI